MSDKIKELAEFLVDVEELAEEKGIVVFDDTIKVSSNKTYVLVRFELYHEEDTE